MDKRSGEETSGTEIQASGDAFVIGESIYTGLAEIAGAIRELAKAIAGGPEDEEPENMEYYLDGTPKR